MQATTTEPLMRICPKCNRHFTDNRMFCPDDGARLTDAQQAGGDNPAPMPDTLDDFEGAETVVSEPRSEQASSASHTRREAPPELTGSNPDNRTDSNNSRDLSMDTSDLIGERLFGEYAIVDKLGEGGMGAVYLAQQASIDQKIAVKVLHEEAANDHEMVQRFHREAQVVSILTHPNIIRVFIFGRTPGGLLYLAMEYVNGIPLRDVIDGGMIDEMRVIKIMKQMCSALSEAHDFGVIHRDLKPDNVLLTEWRGDEDFVKILDFGIAKLKQPDNKEEQQKLTQAGIVYGTPEYLSPEQAQALDLDNRTDLYSLGCMLYEMMTGYLPFDADKPVKIMTAHVYEEVTPPSQVAPNRVSPTMENIIMKALAKDPDDRFQDGMEMFEALVAREREIVQEQNLQGRGAYVPGMEMTGMFTAIELEELEEQSADNSSPPTQPTTAPTQRTGSPQRDTAANVQNHPTSAQPQSQKGSDDTIRVVIYLLIAGTGLLFIVLVVLIALMVLN